MPRPPRIQLEGALYYVTCEGNQKQRIFLGEDDYRSFMGILAKYKTQYNFKLFAYALLPEHFHLLLELTAQDEKSVSLSEIMRDINSTYTKHFNRVHSRTGHLFKQRYSSALVEKEQYLLLAMMYMHSNPERLKLAQSPERYPYTSCTFYHGLSDFSGGIMDEEKKEVELLLSGRTYVEAAEGLGSGANLNLHKRLQKKCVLGSKAFEERVKNEIAAVSNTPEKRQTSLPKAKVSTVVWALTAILTAGIIMFGSIKAASNFSEAKKKADPVRAEYSLPEQLQDIMRRLEGSEWQIRMVPVTGGRVQMDSIKFSEGVFSSDNMVFRGFFPTEYSLVVDDAGGVVYTARMRRGEDTASWHGEISDVGEMRGTLTLRQKGLENRDFSFVSVSYSGKEVWRKLIEPKIRQ